MTRPDLEPRGEELQENGQIGVFQKHRASRTNVDDRKKRLWDSGAYALRLPLLS